MMDSNVVKYSLLNNYGGSPSVIVSTALTYKKSALGES